jgi:hypothetical protein
VFRQINCHFNKRNSPLLSVEVSQSFVSNKRVISITTSYALAINIKELSAWLATISMNNTRENLILVSKIDRCWLPDEVHGQLILLK